VGAGAFHASFPYYQDAGVLGFYRNAHNDWMQWLAELGIVGFVLGAVAVATAFKKDSGKHIYLPRHIRRGIMLGLAGVCLHAILDFPFRIPAISVIIAVWIGMLSKRSSHQEKHRRRT
jgi:O-antigen ligase